MPNSFFQINIYSWPVVKIAGQFPFIKTPQTKIYKSEKQQSVIIGKI
jgi:hypothetical protein